MDPMIHVAELPYRRRRHLRRGALALSLLVAVALGSLSLGGFGPGEEDGEVAPFLAGVKTKMKRRPLDEGRGTKRSVSLAARPQRPKMAKRTPLPVRPPPEPEDDDEDDEDYSDEDDDEGEDEDVDDSDDWEELPPPPPLKFTDADGDVIKFKLNARGALSEYVNGACEVPVCRELHFDAATNTITDESGSFQVPERDCYNIISDLQDLANIATPRVKLRGFPDDDEDDVYERARDRVIGRRMRVVNHEAMQRAIESEKQRIANASTALEGMEKMLAKWREQLAEEEKERALPGLPQWQRIHLAASTKRRRKDIIRLEKDIAAMKKARAYMEETVVLFLADLNETNSGPQLPTLPPCRSVPVAPSTDGVWEFNPLHTGEIHRTENPSKYIVTIAAPGMSMDDVKVSVKGNTLIVKGAIERLLSGGSCVQTLDREFELPVNADASRISASFSEGMLAVEVPKTNAAPEGSEQSVPISIEGTNATATKS